MSTTSSKGPTPELGADTGAQALVGRELERLANQFFAQSFAPPPAFSGTEALPGSADPTGYPAPALKTLDTVAEQPLPIGGALGSATPQQGSVAPPSRLGPSALNVGAGGGSSAVTAPPLPGALQTPPIANAPLPRESDLRNVTAIYAENVHGTSAVPLLTRAETAPAEQPYFLQFAGFPGVGGGQAPTVPVGGVGLPTPGSAPAAGFGGGVPSTAPQGAGNAGAVPTTGFGTNPQGGVPTTSFGTTPSNFDGAPRGSLPSTFYGEPSYAPHARAATPGTRDAFDPARSSIFPDNSTAPSHEPRETRNGVLGDPTALPNIPRDTYSAPRHTQSGTPAPLTTQPHGTTAHVREDAAESGRGFETPQHRLDYDVPEYGLKHDVPHHPGKRQQQLNGLPDGMTLGDGYVPSFSHVRDLSEKPAPRPFDPYSIRRDFPVLEERVHGKRLVWLDNAATTQKPQSVIDRLSYFYAHENSNIHRAAHTLAARATDAYEGAREKVARFLNAGSSKEIIFTRGTTESINLVAKAWGGRFLKSGDEVIVTWLEHHANIVPWQMICEATGAKLRVVPVDDSGQVILGEYAKLLNPRTKMVSITQVSNALGTITPAAIMVQMAKSVGATTLVDGAQAVSHMRVDVQALDCDFYVFSGHKVFGPTGIGALYGKPDVLEQTPPWQGGGNMIADVTFEKTIYNPPPFRFEAGTGNIADAVGLGAALDYVESIGIDNVSVYEHTLLEYGTHHLTQIPGLRMIGTASEKAGVMSFVIEGLDTEKLGGQLDREGVAVRSGHHCAQPILRRFGVEHTVRASLAPYNTIEDLDVLVAAVRRLAEGRGRRY